VDVRRRSDCCIALCANILLAVIFNERPKDAGLQSLDEVVVVMIPRPDQLPPAEGGGDSLAEPITAIEKSALSAAPRLSLQHQNFVCSLLFLFFLDQGITKAVWTAHEGAARAPPTRRFVWSSGVRIRDFETD